MPRRKRFDKNFNETGARNIDREQRMRWEAAAAAKSLPYQDPDRDVSPLVMQSARMGTNFQHNFMMLLARLGPWAYLRIVPTRDKVEYHWFLKFKEGRWANHYLYFYQRECDSPVLAIAVLDKRLDEVEEGIRKPTKDSAFGAE